VFRRSTKNGLVRQTMHAWASKNVFVADASSSLVKVAPRVSTVKFVAVNGALEDARPMTIALRKIAVFLGDAPEVANPMEIVITANVAILSMMFV
jgi:hypothetical protein